MKAVRVKLKAEHLADLLSRKAKLWGGGLSHEQMLSLEGSGHSYTILLGDRPLLCAGVVEYWKGRGESWAIFDPECRRHFVEIHHIVKKYLDDCPVRRIEAAIQVDFTAGHRWIKALGFKLDAEKLEAFLPNGNDVSLYSMVKHG